ncbi:MAG: DUF362 domain-containing protein [Candidatus Latescibacter sp.]|nr:DUF362 domain-containing protein [Candidatus Latescibacter sp.]
MPAHDTHTSDTLDRRSFFRRLSLGTAGLALIGFSESQGAVMKQRGSEKSTVSFLTGKDRREMIYQSLKPFEREVREAIGDKQVVIKINAGLAKPEYSRCSTHADQIRGIMDFLKPIHDRQIIITEGTAGAECSAFIGFENYGYLPLEKEYKARLVDANDQPFTLRFIRAAKHHPEPVNIINMFTDPNVFLISAARMKSHNAVVGTYSLKNCAMGAPVCHYRDKNNEKSKMHGGAGSSGGRELSYNLFLVAQMGVQPDLAVIDGIETIEGDGPWDGTVVEHNVVVSSTDFVAADRLCVELMGIDPKYMKYLEWCSNAGMGNFDLAKIKVNGPDYRKHIIKYKMNKNFDWQVAWINENFGGKK